MKKLLLLTNVLCFSFLLASCQTPKPKNENPVEVKPVIKDTAIAKDTTKTSGQTSSSGTVGGTGSGKPKDTTSKPVKGKPIKHRAPDQAKIDSIKQAKGKGKK